MRLPKRLEAILSLISCEVLADVGTDHGLIPVSAVERCAAVRAIATDISPSSAAKAGALARARGLADRIEIRVGDGLSPVRPGEADAICVSGMGGLLIKDIVQRGLPAARAAKSLILSPQRDVPETRAALLEMGFRIRKEAMVEERGQFYNIIVFQEGEDSGYGPLELMFGKLLLDEGNKALAACLERSLKAGRALDEALSGQDSLRAKERLIVLRKRMEMEKEALEWVSRRSGS